MKSQFPTLIAFADPGAVVAYLHRTPGDLDAKDTLLGELVLAAQSGRHGELPSSLLWLGLWPGLDAIYNRRRKHFPRFPEELVSRISEAFMELKHDQGTGLWLRLQNDEDKAVVVFLGEPHPREVAFVDGKYVEVDEKMKAEGVRASLRIALNVALFDTQEVKVLEQGVVFFKDLVRVREKYGLNKWAVEIQLW